MEQSDNQYSSLSVEDFQKLIDGGFNKILDSESLKDMIPLSKEVIVIWSGGNGPHRYSLQLLQDLPAAFSQKDNVFVAFLDNIGDFPLNQVWEVE